MAAKRQRRQGKAEIAGGSIRKRRKKSEKAGGRKGRKEGVGKEGGSKGRKREVRQARREAGYTTEGRVREIYINTILYKDEE